MKGKKKFAALLLSLLMAFLVLPVSALAATGPAPVLNTSTTQPLIADADVGKTNGTLTITKVGSQSTFAIYQLYSMTADSSTRLYTYARNADFSGSSLPTDANVIKDFSADQLSALTQSLRGVISKSTDLKVYGEKPNDNLDPAAKEQATLVSGTPDTYQATFSGLALGYYLVIETETTGAKTASKDFLVSVPSVDGTGTAHWIYDVTADCKDSPVHTDKTITGSLTDVTTIDLTGATRNIGDPVDYRLDADVPQYDDTVTDITFVMNDTLSKGLTYNDDPGDSAHNVKIYGFNGTTTAADSTNNITDHFDIAVSGYDSINGTTLTITCKSDADFKAIAATYSKVSAFYSATLNEHAVIGNAGNPNDYYLDYTNGPGTHVHSENHHTYVYTFGLEIVKLDADSVQTFLPDAVFSLLDENKASISGFVNLQTGPDGKLDFSGIKEGTYYVHEVTPPAGYGLLGYDIKVVIEAIKNNGQPTGEFTCTYYDATESNPTTADLTEDPTDPTIKIFATFNVFDKKGFTLPGTGGIGTKIFYASGSGILLAGGCMAVGYTRKKKKTIRHFKQQ